MKTLDELLRIAQEGGDTEYDNEFWMSRETVVWLIKHCMELQHAREVEVLHNQKPGDIVSAGVSQ